MKILFLVFALLFSRQGYALSGKPICEDFSSYSAGADLSAVSGWYKAGSGTLTIDTSATFGSLAAKHTASGGWLQSEYRGAWTTTDFSARLSNPYYVMVRQQNLTGIFSPAYYVRFNSGTSISVGKICGGNNYDAITATVSVTITDLTARITMSGLVMSVYLNDSLVAVHDFTGNVFCSSAVYNTGGIGFQYINATTYIDNIVVNGGTCEESEDSLSPHRWNINSPKMFPNFQRMLKLFLMPKELPALESDSRPVATAVAVKAIISKELYTKKLLFEGKITATRSPTTTPVSKLTQSPTATATRTPTPAPSATPVPKQTTVLQGK